MFHIHICFFLIDRVSLATFAYKYPPNLLFFSSTRLITSLRRTALLVYVLEPTGKHP
jgi:hypothetical protein